MSRSPQDPRFILALDQGTTSSRAIVFDRGGRRLGQVQKEFRQIYPRPGWVEHDPQEIWRTQLEAAREVLTLVRIGPKEVASLGLTNQRETTVVWDRDSGRPLYNAIVWQCRRTSALCDRLRADGLAGAVRERTGLVIDPYFSATKLRWLLDNVPGLEAAARTGRVAFGTIDSWLLWNLTGGRLHATDVSNASRTMLFNIKTLDWDDDMLEIFRVPRSALPKVHPSSGRLGLTDPALLGESIPIAGVAGDQQAALFGQACFEPGMAKTTYGTGCFLLLNTGPAPVFSSKGLLTTVAWGLPDGVTYALEGSVFVGGAAVQWLRDGLGIIATAAESEPLAASVPDTGGVYFVPAFVGLGAPHWDAYARGLLIGLTRGTSRAHLARAALEAIAYQTRDVLEAMTADSGLPLKRMRADGGAAVNNLLMQFQADILGVGIERPRVSETTALGAAYLAGLATGFWRDRTEIAGQWTCERLYHPTMSPERRELLYRGWRRAVARALTWEEAIADSTSGGGEGATRDPV